MWRFAVLASVLVVGDPAPADACSPSPCNRGYFVPASNTTVPANIPALYWQPVSPSWQPDYTPEIDKLQFFGSSGVPPALTVSADDSVLRPSFVLALDGPLLEGATYALVDRNECEYSWFEPPSSTFLAGPSAPLPATLGTLVKGTWDLSALSVATASGSCDARVEVRRQLIHLQISSEAQPWQDVLHFQTFIDGKPWSYVSSLGATKTPGATGYGRNQRHDDVIYTVCATDDASVLPGIAPGIGHEVVMRATLPGTDLVLETPPITIELDCPPDPTLPDPPPVAETGCATSRPSLVVLVALLALRRRRSKPPGYQT